MCTNAERRTHLFNGTQVGDTVGAIQHYELAGTHCVEVPRMLFERDRVEDLEEYITQVGRTPHARP